MYYWRKSCVRHARINDTRAAYPNVQCKQKRVGKDDDDTKSIVVSVLFDTFAHGYRSSPQLAFRRDLLHHTHTTHGQSKSLEDFARNVRSALPRLSSRRGGRVFLAQYFTFQFSFSKLFGFFFGAGAASCADRFDVPLETFPFVSTFFSSDITGTEEGKEGNSAVTFDTPSVLVSGTSLSRIGPLNVCGSTA